jgi:hypothetical protein
VTVKEAIASVVLALLTLTSCGQSESDAEVDRLVRELQDQMLQEQQDTADEVLTLIEELGLTDDG